MARRVKTMRGGAINALAALLVIAVIIAIAVILIIKSREEGFSIPALFQTPDGWTLSPEPGYVGGIAIDYALTDGATTLKETTNINILPTPAVGASPL